MILAIRTIALSVLVCCAVACSSEFKQRARTPLGPEEARARLEGYSSLEERVRSADLIVVGKLDNLRRGFELEYDQEWHPGLGDDVIGYNVIDLEIERVIKGYPLGLGSKPGKITLVFYSSWVKGGKRMSNGSNRLSEGDSGVWLLRAYPFFGRKAGVYGRLDSQSHLPRDAADEVLQKLEGWSWD